MRRKFYTILRANVKTLTIVPENTRIVPLQPAGERPPFFMVDSFPCFIDVVKIIGADQPVLSLICQEETQTSDRYSIVDEAAAHVETILGHQPQGPYMLGGCSSSGIVAYEVAQQLRALGREVGLLVMFDAPNPFFMREYSRFWMSVNSYRDDLSKLGWKEIPGWAAGKFWKLTSGESAWLRNDLNTAYGASRSKDQFAPLSSRIDATRKYRPAPYAGRFLLVKRFREL